MSKTNYFISPELLRELDAIRALLEEQILSDEEYGTISSMRKFFVLRGFNDAIGYITNLTHGYNDSAAGIKEKLLDQDYVGMVIDLDELEDEEG